MRKMKSAAVLFLSLSVVLNSAVLAWPKAKRLDRNRDGEVGQKESALAKKQGVRVNTWWEKKADTNNDGLIDTREKEAWQELQAKKVDLNHDGTVDASEKQTYWKRNRSKVNTSLEVRYDANADGWLDSEEAKTLLKDKILLIKTKGKALADTDLEKAYDTNENGLIDSGELRSMEQDIR